MGTVRKGGYCVLMTAYSGDDAEGLKYYWAASLSVRVTATFCTPGWAIQFTQEGTLTALRSRVFIYHMKRIRLENIYIGTMGVFSIYNTSLPGSICNIVFTLSRNTFALCSSPFGTLTLKTLIAEPPAVPAELLGGALALNLAPNDGLPANMSIMSGFFAGAVRDVGTIDGKATI